MQKTLTTLSLTLLLLITILPTTIHSLEEALPTLKIASSWHKESTEIAQILHHLTRHLREHREEPIQASLTHTDQILNLTLTRVFPVSLLLTPQKTATLSLSNYLLAINLPNTTQTLRRGQRIKIKTLDFQVLYPAPTEETQRAILLLQLTEREEREVELVEITEPVPAPPETAPIKPQEIAYDTININTASLEELQEITGVGPAYAERIIEYRNTHGPFQHIQEIKNIHGIGEVRFENMKSEIRVGD